MLSLGASEARLLFQLRDLLAGRLFGVFRLIRQAVYHQIAGANKLFVAEPAAPSQPDGYN
jgi:hypothetical protein